MEIVMDVVT